jgi:hypothetical protein
MLGTVSRPLCISTQRKDFVIIGQWRADTQRTENRPSKPHFD